jgi:hypothetical protein
MNNKKIIILIVCLLVWFNWDKLKPQVTITPVIKPPSIPSLPIPHPFKPKPKEDPQPEPPAPVPTPSPAKPAAAKCSTGHWVTQRVGLFRTRKVWVCD